MESEFVWHMQSGKKLEIVRVHVGESERVKDESKVKMKMKK